MCGKILRSRSSLRFSSRSRAEDDTLLSHRKIANRRRRRGPLGHIPLGDSFYCCVAIFLGKLAGIRAAINHFSVLVKSDSKAKFMNFMFYTVLTEIV